MWSLCWRFWRDIELFDRTTAISQSNGRLPASCVNVELKRTRFTSEDSFSRLDIILTMATARSERVCTTDSSDVPSLADYGEVRNGFQRRHSGRFGVGPHSICCIHSLLLLLRLPSVLKWMRWWLDAPYQRLDVQNLNSFKLRWSPWTPTNVLILYSILAPCYMRP